MYSLAMDTLMAQPNRSGDAEENLRRFADLCGTYASFELKIIPGNKNLSGGSISENNHASVLHYLNRGDRSCN